MNFRKLWPGLFRILVVLTVLAAVAAAGYCFGFQQGRDVVLSIHFDRKP